MIFKEEKKSFFGKMSQRISDALAGKATIDDDFMDELEEILITSDIGMETTMKIVDMLRTEVKTNNLTKPSVIKIRLAKIIASVINKKDAQQLCQDTPLVILMIGINGGGKTTSIGKLAHKLRQEGKTVMLAAADTFRAGALDQIDTWAQRIGVPCIKGKPGQDPSSVLVDACRYAKENDIDILIGDTAGRLQNKKNLMKELEKMTRVIGREIEGAPQEVWLVLDATTGQNGISQAQVFLDATHVTGIVLTKMDGTAKGGVVLSIHDMLHLPVRFLGLGEKPEDLRPFDVASYIMGMTKGMNLHD